MTAEWLTVLLLALGLVGGGIWASVTYFASNKYADALNVSFKDIQNEFRELKESIKVFMANEVYYRKHIEEQKEVIRENYNTLKNVDDLFRTIKSRLDGEVTPRENNLSVVQSLQKEVKNG